MNKYIAIIVTIILFNISGCSGTPTKLTDESRKHIKSISIKVQPIDHAPMIYTSAEEISGLTTFIVAGSQASNEAMKNAQKGPAKTFSEFLIKNDITIEKIVANEFRKQIKKTKIFNITNIEQSDAIITARIGRYGFNQTGLWSSTQRAEIYVYVDVTNKNNEVIAKILGYASPFRDKEQFTIEEIYKNPAAVRKSFEEATMIAVNDIVEKMISK